MTHSEFNHLLSSINSLSPEQMRQFRHELDNRLAPSVTEDRQAGEQQVSLQLQQELLDAGIIERIEASQTGLTPNKTPSSPDSRGAHIGNRHPRAPLRWRFTSGHRAVIKRYVKEIGTAWVQPLTLPTAPHSHFLAQSTWVETISAVTRRERSGHLSPPGAAGALSDFQQDLGGNTSLLRFQRP